VRDLTDPDRARGVSSDEFLGHPEVSKRDIKGILVISEHRAFERDRKAEGPAP
jgi:hypothetical protein